MAESKLEQEQQWIRSRQKMTNREKFKEVFGMEITSVATTCHQNGFCLFCDNVCQWWDREYKDGGK
jgi:hypothetical protein